MKSVKAPLNIRIRCRSVIDDGAGVAESQIDQRLSAVSFGRNFRELDSLVRRVFLSPNGVLPQVVVFAGADDSAESALLAAQVAQILADQSGRRVCLIEADVRDRSLLSLLDINEENDSDHSPEPRSRNASGSSLWIADENSLGWNGPATFTKDTIVGNLDKLRCGYDFIMINAGNASSSGYAINLGKMADGLILVLRANSTRKKVAQVVTADLKAAGVALIGAVLSDRSFPIPELLYRRF